MASHTHEVVGGEVGFVTEAKGYLLTLEGLPSTHVNDLVVNKRGERALVTALLEGYVEALLLDKKEPRIGDQFMVRSSALKLSLSEKLLGRAISALGDPLDGKGEIQASEETLQLETAAPGMDSRASMTEQLYTGMTAIDTLLPLAKGQRQLVIGPTSSGKALFLESAVSHQRSTSSVCIYAFIGRPLAYVKEVTARLLSPEGNQKTIIIAAFSDEPAPLIYLTPIVSFALAERFSKSGKDVLLILDDLGTHAKYVREIALLSGRIPGRESYPGDMFHEHARLMERAGYFNKRRGGGSITALPVLETGIEDITSLVPTNLMAATDGHLFFSPSLHAEGYFPAVSSNESVTRVGRQVQSHLSKQLSIRIQALLAEYERHRDYSQFGTQLSEETRKTIVQGELTRALLRQEPLTSVSGEEQVILLSLVFTPLFHNRDTAFVAGNRQALVKVLKTHRSLEPVVLTARRGTISLDQFVKRLETVLPYFEAVCRQP